MADVTIELSNPMRPEDDNVFATVDEAVVLKPANKAAADLLVGDSVCHGPAVYEVAVEPVPA